MNITLYPLHDYNNGTLNAFTIELDGLTEDDYKQAINRGLWSHSKSGNVTSTKCNSCDHVHIAEELAQCFECESKDVTTKLTTEEWIVCDSDGIPGDLVGEYDLSPDFWPYLSLLESTDLDPEIINAGILCNIPLDSIEEAYSGTYRDDEEFAYDMADSCGQIDHDAKWPQSCIDWTQAARELMWDYTEANGHYFSNNW